jgi:hypothetical protein
MNYFTLQLWQEDSPPVFSAGVACFLAGAAISPLIAIPFLPKGNHDALYGNLAQTVAMPVSSNNHNVSVGVSEPGYFNDTMRTNAFSDLGAPFGPRADALTNSTFSESLKNDSIGVLANNTFGNIPSVLGHPMRDLYFVMMAFGLFSALFVTSGSLWSSQVGLAAKELSESRKEDPIVGTGLSRIFVIIFCLLYQVLIIGLEVLFIGLIPSYMVEELGGSPQDGTLITSIFWGIYTVVAIVGVGLAHYLTPSTILLFDNVILTAGAAILLCGSQNSTLVLIGTAVLAVGYGPVYATIFLWGDHYISLTRKLTGVFVAAPELGGVIMPVIGGQFFSKYPGSLMVMAVILSVLSDVMFVLTESIAFPLQQKTQEAKFGWRQTKGYDTIK